MDSFGAEHKRSSAVLLAETLASGGTFGQYASAMSVSKGQRVFGTPAISTEHILKAQTEVLSKLSSSTAALLRKAEAADLILKAKATAAQQPTTRATAADVRRTSVSSTVNLSAIEHDSVSGRPPSAAPVRPLPGAAPHHAEPVAQHTLRQAGAGEDGGDELLQQVPMAGIPARIPAEERDSYASLQALYNDAVHEKARVAVQLADTARLVTDRSQHYEQRIQAAQDKVRQLEEAMASGSHSQDGLVAELQRSVASLKHRLEASEAERDGTAQQLRQARAEGDAWQHKASEVQDQCARLQRELHREVSNRGADQEARFRGLRADLDRAQADTHQADQAAREARDEVQKLLAERQTLLETCSTLRQQLSSQAASHSVELVQSTQACDRVDGEVVRLRQAVAAKDGELELLKSQVQQIKEERRLAVSEAHSARDEVERQRAAARDRVGHLEEQLRQAQAAGQLAAAEIRRLTDTAELAMQQAGESDMFVRRLQSSLGDAQAAFQRSLAEARAMFERQARDDVQRVTSKAGETVADAEARAASMQARVSSLEQDLVAARAERQALLDQERRARQELQDERERAMAALAKQHAAELTAVRAHLDSSHTRHTAEVEVRLGRLQDEARQALGHADARVKEADDRTTRALQACEEYRGRCETLQAELASCQKVVAEHRALLQEERMGRHGDAGRMDLEMQRMSQEVTAAQQTIRTLQEQNSGLQSEVQQSQARCLKLERALTDTREHASGLREQLGSARLELGDAQHKVAALEGALASSQAGRAAEVSGLGVALEDAQRGLVDMDAALAGQRTLLADVRQEAARVRKLLDEERQASARLRSDLDAEGERAARDRSEAAQHEARLQEHLARTTAELERTSEQLQAADRDCTVLKDAVDRLRKGQASAMEQQRHLVQLNDQLTRDLELTEARLAVAQRTGQDMEERVEALTEEKQALLTTEAQLRSDLASTDERCRGLQAELDRTLDQCSGLQHEVDRLGAQLGMHKAAETAADQKVASIASLLAQAREDADRLVTDNARERGRADAVTGQLQDAHKRAEAAEAKVTAAEQARRVAEAKASDMSQTLSSVQRDSDSKSREVDRLASELGKARAGLDRAKDEVSAAVQAKEELQQALAYTKEALASARADTECAVSELERCMAGRDGLARQLEHARADLATERTRAQAAQQEARTQHTILDTSMASHASKAMSSPVKTPSRRSALRQSSLSPARSAHSGVRVTVLEPGMVMSPGRALVKEPAAVPSVLVAQLSSLRQELHAALGQRDHAHAQADGLRSQLTTATVELSHTREQLAQAQADLTQARRPQPVTVPVPAVTDAGSPALAATVTSLQQALAAESTSRQGMEAELRRLQSSLEHSQSRVQALAHEAREAAGHVATLTAAVEAASKGAQAAQAQAKQAGEAEQQAQYLLQEARLQLQQLQTTASESSRTAERRVAEAERWAHDATIRCEALQAEVRMAETAVTRADAELDATVARAEERVAAAHREAKALVAQAGKGEDELRAVLAVRDGQLARLTELTGEYGRWTDKVLQAAGLGSAIVPGALSTGPADVQRAMAGLLDLVQALRRHGQGDGTGRTQAGLAPTTSQASATLAGRSASSGPTTDVRAALLAYAAPLTGAAGLAEDGNISAVRRANDSDSALVDGLGLDSSLQLPVAVPAPVTVLDRVTASELLSHRLGHGAVEQEQAEVSVLHTEQGLAWPSGAGPSASGGPGTASGDGASNWPHASTGSDSGSEAAPARPAQGGVRRGRGVQLRSPPGQ